MSPLASIAAHSDEPVHAAAVNVCPGDAEAQVAAGVRAVDRARRSSRPRGRSWSTGQETLVSVSPLSWRRAMPSSCPTRWSEFTTTAPDAPTATQNELPGAHDDGLQGADGAGRLLTARYRRPSESCSRWRLCRQPTRRGPRDGQDTPVWARPGRRRVPRAERRSRDGRRGGDREHAREQGGGECHARACPPCVACAEPRTS